MSRSYISLFGSGGDVLPAAAGGFLPSDISNLEAWYRYNTGITITGAGVSQWDDQTVNARHVTQGTDANRPTNSGGTITFDGSNDRLASATLSVANPYTVVARILQDTTWTLNDTCICTRSDSNHTFYQSDSSPELRIWNGAAESTVNPDLAMDTWGTIIIEYTNTVGCSLQVNDGTPVTSGNTTGTFTQVIMGSSGTPDAWGRFKIRDVAIYSKLLSTQEKSDLRTYMSGLGA